MPEQENKRTLIFIRKEMKSDLVGEISPEMTAEAEQAPLHHREENKSQQTL